MYVGQQLLTLCTALRRFVKPMRLVDAVAFSKLPFSNTLIVWLCGRAVIVLACQKGFWPVPPVLHHHCVVKCKLTQSLMS